MNKNSVILKPCPMLQTTDSCHEPKSVQFCSLEFTSYKKCMEHRQQLPNKKEV